MNLEKGELIVLDDNKEYIVVDVCNCNAITYIYLITSNKPVEILLVKEKIVDGIINLVPVDNYEEAKYVIDVIANKN